MIWSMSGNGGVADSADEFRRIKAKLHRQLISAMDFSALGSLKDDELRREVRAAAEQLCNQSSELLSQANREALISEVMDETFGLGPLQSLMSDPEISDILVNGASDIYVERRGLLEHVEGLAFYNNAHLLQIIQRIVGRVGRRVDESSPMVDARLPDGSRVNAIIPPLALDGPLLSIRRFGTRPLTADSLVANHSLTRDMLAFLTACIESRLSVLISGGTGSGKTTLLNVLSGAIPTTERIATIEDSAELRLQQRHVVRMETRPPNIEGQGQITQRDLVRNALRMRPDRIIVGECRGGEAIDMLQAMNTGHEGSLTTIHANSARDATSRLEVMVGMAGYEMPIWVVRRQIASAINLVVQVARLSGGLRKVVSVSEITGMEGEVISMHDIFLFKQTGIDARRRALGYFCSTGVRPHCLSRLEAYGISFSPSLFEARMMTDSEPPRNCQKGAVG
ncbi:MAG: CpaF family protein [Planctomycetota bacterium]